MSEACLEFNRYEGGSHVQTVGYVCLLAVDAVAPFELWPPGLIVSRKTYSYPSFRISGSFQRVNVLQAALKMEYGV